MKPVERRRESASIGLKDALAWMVGAPRDELAVFRDRDLDPLSGEVGGGVADEARVEHARVPVQCLDAADGRHGLDHGWCAM
jgi:hypothetical protein